MKASELRIGNLIKGKSPEKKVYEEPVELNEYYFLLFLNNMMDVEPIPLTEEWLLKLGFKQCGYEMLSWKHETLLPSFDLGGINWADFDEPDYQFLTYKVADEILRIDYVHQLQNLYFALTGEELKQQEQ
jgi:hypothetical protein